MISRPRNNKLRILDLFTKLSTFVLEPNFL